MSKNKVGYDFESELKSIFSNIQSKCNFFWHQFADSKAARGFINSQPSDFIIASEKTGAMLVEAKASEEISSLAKCAKKMLRPSQVGSIIKWNRAGQRSLILFYCEIDGVIEVWDGMHVVSCIRENKKLSQKDSVRVNFSSLEFWLTEYIKG